MTVAQRTAEFANDQSYEALLESINSHVEGWSRTDSMGPRRPVLFIVGIPRTGTTLLYQLLAASGAFDYPSNFIARFYRSPAYGACIQRLALPLLPRGAQEWSSRAGHTPHWWGPHEFGYFWQHHLPLTEHHEPSSPSMDGLVRAIAAFEAECTRPLLFKNGILCYVLRDLARAMPTARFLHIERNPLDVAVSLHQMRERLHGDARPWWSLRPRQVDMTASPEDQIAWQVAHAKSALHEAGREIGVERWADTSYVELCADPHAVVRQAAALAGVQVEVSTLPTRFDQPAARTGALAERLQVALARRGL